MAFYVLMEPFSIKATIWSTPILCGTNINYVPTIGWNPFWSCIYTGCPIDLSSILISISDFSDCPIKKDYICNKNPNGLT